MTTTINWISTKERLPEEDGTYLCIQFPPHKDECGHLRVLEFTKEVADILYWDEEDVDGGLGPAFYEYDCEYEPYVYDDIWYWAEMPVFHRDKTKEEDQHGD